jgi:hypothetical protein
MSSPWSNYLGYGIPYHGDGKAGFIAALWFFGREILAVELNTPLEIGVSYFVSMQLLRTFGGGLHSNCNCAVNNLGLKFLKQTYDPWNPMPIDNFAHILHEEVLTDSTNWTEVSGWIIADSAYTHLAIGVFFDNDNITIENYNNYEMGYKTYYFVDAVCVTTNPAECDELRPLGVVSNTTPNPITLYPNPSSSFVRISSDFSLKSMQVFDVAGKQLFTRNLWGNSSDIDINFLSTGLYVFRVEFENGTITNVSFIKH